MYNFQKIKEETFFIKNESDSTKLDGASLNEVVEATKQKMHEQHQNNTKLTPESLGEEISRERKNRDEKAAILAGEVLPGPTCTLHEAARFCGISEGNFLEILSKHGAYLGAANRSGYPNEFWSSLIHGHRAFIRKCAGLETPHAVKKSSDGSEKNISITPTKDELIWRFGIRIKKAVE